jgi:outer membrane PBP1 activator LpoA protein
MPFGLRAQVSILFVLTLSSPALCAAADDPASNPAASAPAAATPPPGSAPSSVTTPPTVPTLPAPPTSPTVPTPPAPPAPPPKPFVALLLPLDSPDFVAPADAVRLGCEASQTHAQPKQAVQVVRTDARPQTILTEYSAAVKRGAVVVVGPMTRSGVSAIATGIQSGVPTLALNVPEGNPTMPPWLYTFGLSIEAEARLVAHAASAAQLRDAVVVGAATQLEQRATQAFAEEWSALGGKIIAIEQFAPGADYSEMQVRLSAAQAQMTFLAADAEQARAVRPYLNNQNPVWATSQIYSGRADPLGNLDLNGIRFVDMPWLVQPDHPAVMVYPRSSALSLEMQRFYALGIDACRIAAQLVARSDRSIRLDGVTGRITLGGGARAFQRQPVLAVIREGAGVALEDQR